MDPIPIHLAPKDGTPILTDQGIVRWCDQRNWGSPVPHEKWVLCDPWGNLTREEGEHGAYCVCNPAPVRWCPLPDWVTS